ncbi:hypothetical protein [Fowlpox virus]|uniref:Uncharacterized protein FPV237 n=2 Tax=Fowlpox virus TaxID=10261 RepID=V237_FOWPN|nr:hypothetical protein FPV237 [Fowlpox virus]P14366.1 RecName: Full=Uncharacterized protein FPV237; AltName: Full=BamHI-ORF9 [Fowlpox virus strain NVSL]WPD90982.1 hypothetical protein PPV_Vac110-fpv237 [Avipoxvirus sp.]CAE52772.1 hypothetical protein [Fowlpox virus isolate HP-438/Munich]AAF44581.1 ORF FPV237 hypothetical protein [Fowlpox virus]ART91670.1 hypothetical protein [Fowlpox virus]AXY04678.1 hypothetical protein [Fowlpox virus]
MSSLKYANTDITIKMVIITPKVLEDDSLSESSIHFANNRFHFDLYYIKPWAFVSILYLFLCFLYNII